MFALADDGNSFPWMSQVRVLASGDIVVAGALQGTIDFGGGPLTAAGGIQRLSRAVRPLRGLRLRPPVRRDAERLVVDVRARRERERTAGDRYLRRQPGLRRRRHRGVDLDQLRLLRREVRWPGQPHRRPVASFGRPQRRSRHARARRRGPRGGGGRLHPAHRPGGRSPHTGGLLGRLRRGVRAAPRIPLGPALRRRRLPDPCRCDDRWRGKRRRHGHAVRKRQPRDLVPTDTRRRRKLCSSPGSPSTAA